MAENVKKKRTGWIIGGAVAGLGLLIVGAIAVFLLVFNRNELAGRWELTDTSISETELYIEQNNDIELYVSPSENYDVVILNRLVPVKNQKDEYMFDENIKKIEVRFNSLETMLEEFGLDNQDITDLDGLKEQMRTSFEQSADYGGPNFTDEEINTILSKIKETDGNIVWLFEEEELTNLEGLFSSNGIPSIEQFEKVFVSITIRKADEDTLEFENAIGDVIEFEKIEEK